MCVFSIKKKGVESNLDSRPSTPPDDGAGSWKEIKHLDKNLEEFSNLGVHWPFFSFEQWGKQKRENLTIYVLHTYVYVSSSQSKYKLLLLSPSSPFGPHLL